MNNYLSVKFKVVSFFLIIMVIYLHSYNLNVSVNNVNREVQRGYSTFFQDFIHNGINRIPSSLFFVISGYLFFINIQGKPHEFIAKFKKRLKTVVVPYLIWSIWGLLLYYILQLAPHCQTFFSKELIKDYSFGKLINSIFINPIPYQFWFLKDLFLLICITPIIYILIKYLKIYAVLILLILWLYGSNFVIFYDRSLFFFVFGAFLSSKNDMYIQINFSRHAMILISLWTALAISITLLEYNQFKNELALLLLNKVATLIGVFGIWGLYDKLFLYKDLTKFKFYTIFSFSFFLYAFHEPLLTIFKKGLFFIMGKGAFVSLFVFLLAPLLTITISIFLSYYLKQVTPKFYRLITGTR